MIHWSFLIWMWFVFEFSHLNVFSLKFSHSKWMLFDFVSHHAHMRGIGFGLEDKIRAFMFVEIWTLSAKRIGTGRKTQQQKNLHTDNLHFLGGRAILNVPPSLCGSFDSSWTFSWQGEGGWVKNVTLDLQGSNVTYILPRPPWISVLKG